MKLFLDSADCFSIERVFNTGLIDGITTNPTLIRNSGEKPEKIYEFLVNLGVPDISMEVSGTASEMEIEAITLAETFGKAATIKLPMTRQGLDVCSVLNERDIRTNITLVFNAAQAILAAKAGATYVSPFVGRVDDQGYAGLEVVRSIADLYCRHGVRTQVLAASIRTPHRAVRSFYNGASVCTVPVDVFWKMYDHILTDAGLAIFENDLEKTNTLS